MVNKNEVLDKRIVRSALSNSEAKNTTPQQIIEQAISGNKHAIKDLICWLTPVIQTSAASALTRFNLRLQDCHGHSDIADYCQDVFMHLFENNQRVLRSWDPEKGMGLTSFVSLVTKRRVISSLRSSKNFQRLDNEVIEAKLQSYNTNSDEENRFSNRNYLRRIIQMLKGTISEVGYDLFVQLFLYELSVAEVSAKTGISKNAIYVWKNRLRNQARNISKSLDDQNEGNCLLSTSRLIDLETLPKPKKNRPSLAVALSISTQEVHCDE